MRIALVDGSPTTSISLYPLPLLKLGAWRKSLGDECVLFSARLPKAGEFDEIWITTRFTYDLNFAVSMAQVAQQRANRVWVGGVSASLFPERFAEKGIEVHQGLLPAAEVFAPDYSLLSGPPKYSITHTSRGCIRKCGFCMVTKLEPIFASRPTWAQDLHPTTDRILFYDNNWLAKPAADFETDTRILKTLVKSGRIKSFDFNQGLDARLVTDEIADMLQGLPLKPVRFAFDGMQEDGHYQRAVEKMIKRGFREFVTYVLYNFKDTPQDFYYRLRESARLLTEHGGTVASYPMRFQPIMEADLGRSYTGKHWTVDQKKGFMAVLSQQSTMGQVSLNLDNFEYWFGKTADDFAAMLGYSKIRELARRKKGAARWRRAQGTT